jgi:hypothetical protein
VLFVSNEGDRREVVFEAPGELVPHGHDARDLVADAPVAIERDDDRVRLRVRLDEGASHVIAVRA